MRKLVVITVAVLGILCLTACSSDTGEAEEFDLHGKGLEQIMQVDIPEGYEQEKNEVRSEGGELISRFYGKEDNSVHNSIYFIILSYEGKAVMGSDETIEEWLEDKDNIAETIPIENADSEAYIYPIGFNTDDEREGVKDMIEAVFGYHDYLISVGMMNPEGEDLTKEQKAIFRDVLDSIKLIDKQ